MSAEQQASPRTEDFDPLIPIDVITPPMERGPDDLHTSAPIKEPSEVAESAIQEKRPQTDVPANPETPQQAVVEEQEQTHADIPSNPETPEQAMIEEQERTHADIPLVPEGAQEEDQAEGQADFPDYKGDRNAPVDAEHPLANPPASQEEMTPPDPRD